MTRIDIAINTIDNALSTTLKVADLRHILRLVRDQLEEYKRVQQQ